MYDIGHMNILIDVFGIMILSVLLVLLLTGSDRHSRLNLLFMRLIVCHLATLSLDLLSRSMVGNTAAYSSALAHIAVFLCYSLSYLEIPLFSDYVAALVAGDSKSAKIVSRMMYALFWASVALLIVSQWSGMLYYFDHNNTYIAGRYFWLGQVQGLILASIVTAFILMHRKRTGTRDTIFLLSYALYPALAITIQTAFIAELELLFMAMTVSAVSIYGGIQARQARLYKEHELHMERELADSKVAIMLSQIQPHFLYNALVVIRHLCKIDPAAAEETVMEFSEYLRGNLDALARNEPIPFKKELRHVETYLKIEKKRFGGKLKVRYDIKAKDFWLPALTLQPMVENAVRYGITKKEQGGTVTISTYASESEHVITVNDDGVGFDVDREPEDDGRIHVGIENTRSRLEAMCGGTLAVQSLPGAGTTVTITIPRK